jgi:hypothetical protein
MAQGGATRVEAAGVPDSGSTDSAFGQLTSAQSPRILQFSLKTLF